LTAKTKFEINYRQIRYQCQYIIYLQYTRNDRNEWVSVV